MDIYAICMVLWTDPDMRMKMYYCVYPEDEICRKMMLDEKASIVSLYNELSEEGLLPAP